VRVAAPRCSRYQNAEPPSILGVGQIHGAAQNRRGEIERSIHTLGAPSSSPHRGLRPIGFFPRRALRPTGSGAYTRDANSRKWQRHPSRTRTTTRTRTIAGSPPNDSKTGGKRWTSCDPGPVGGLDRPSVGAGLGRWPVVESLRQNRPHPGIG
jgi:hypothetical protein